MYMNIVCLLHKDINKNNLVIYLALNYKLIRYSTHRHDYKQYVNISLLHRVIITILTEGEH